MLYESLLCDIQSTTSQLCQEFPFQMHSFLQFHEDVEDMDKQN